MSRLTEVKALMTGVININIGLMPDAPDNAVALFNTGGYSRSLTGSLVSQPTFQVRVRNTSYATGEALCVTIKNLLHGVTHNGNFLLIAQEGDIMDLGRDENQRQEWTLNFRTLYKS